MLDFLWISPEIGKYEICFKIGKCHMNKMYAFFVPEKSEFWRKKQLKSLKIIIFVSDFLPTIFSLDLKQINAPHPPYNKHT